MKKIIAIVTIGASTAFLQVQAQEAPQTQRDQQPTTQTTQDAPTKDNKVKIDKSELPQEVMDSFEKSEYSDMDIVTVYEVQSSEDGESTSYELMTNDGKQTEISAPSDKGTKSNKSSTKEASRELEDAANQTEQSVEEAATGMKQDAEEVANETENTSKEVSKEVKDEASEFAQETEQTTKDAAQKAEETTTDAIKVTKDAPNKANKSTNDLSKESGTATSGAYNEAEKAARETGEKAATDTEAVIGNASQAVGDTAINEMEGGDQMKQTPETATDPAQQPIDSASSSVMKEDKTEMAQTESTITEMETTEEAEETGEVVTAQNPDDDAQPAEGAEKMGKELYENNQYDNYTDVNSDAYEKIAKEEGTIATKGNTAEDSKKYELQVTGENQKVTLTYDENGELVKTRKENM